MPDSDTPAPGDPALDRPSSPYDALDAAQIVSTAELLSRRIDERFQGSGLHAVSLHLVVLSREAEETADWIARPILWLRVATGLLALLILAGLVASVVSVPLSSDVGLLDLVGALEAGINDVVLVGAGVFFLVTLEARIKRHRALDALRRLRSLAHIIDMHQLTKSPDRIDPAHQPTASSPRSALTPFQLGRYLDYCSEMLSLNGKIAALYIQDFDDAVALGTVNEIEDLSTGLSRKIWQKRIALPHGDAEA